MAVDLSEKPILHFVRARIVELLEAAQRQAKYDLPLDAALHAASLGRVKGGGTARGQHREILWVGIDVELVDLDRGLPLVKQTLRELGAPPGSVLEVGDEVAPEVVPIHEEGQAT